MPLSRNGSSAIGVTRREGLRLEIGNGRKERLQSLPHRLVTLPCEKGVKEQLVDGGSFLRLLLEKQGDPVAEIGGGNTVGSGIGVEGGRVVLTGPCHGLHGVEVRVGRIPLEQFERGDSQRPDVGLDGRGERRRTAAL